jgi:hypothetical protein
MDSKAELEDQIMNAWNLNYSLEGNVNFISEAMSPGFQPPSATKKQINSFIEKAKYGTIEPEKTSFKQKVMEGLVNL